MTWDQLHDEDVLFEFTGSRPDELGAGRFYRGTVDGFADFGVFVTIGESVTGLLHRSNIDGRLENLDWDEGDEVIVQVEGVRENGNVDLSWSIRQSPEEFRGSGVHDPTGEAEAPEETPTEVTSETPAEDTPDTPAEESAPEVSERSFRTVDVTDLEDSVGDRVRLLGRITDIHQTNGPTLFTLRDDTGDIECAAFEAAGVRAFPEIEIGDIVSLVGRAERHRGNLQVETESIDALADEERREVAERIDAAETERAEPDDASLVLDDETLRDHADACVETATALRRATFDGRSIVIRHPTSVDGVVAGAGLEHALRTLTERTHDDQEVSSWFVTRRPMDDSWYDLGDAMYDVTDGASRNDLVVVVGAGDSPQDEAALEFLAVYDLEYAVVDTHGTDVDHVAALATNVAGMVDETVREDLVHLPAIGVGAEAPESYRTLAGEHDYDESAIAERHEALALVAYYQRYDDKRELVADLLFDGEEAGDLASHVSGQFRQRLDTAIATAIENGTVRNGVFALDADALTHRFTFPPRALLADTLAREVDAETVLVLDEDEAYIAGKAVDLDALATEVADAVRHAAVTASRDRITFLAGKREAVLDALVDALAS